MAFELFKDLFAAALCTGLVGEIEKACGSQAGQNIAVLVGDFGVATFLKTLADIILIGEVAIDAETDHARRTFGVVVGFTDDIGATLDGIRKLRRHLRSKASRVEAGAVAFVKLIEIEVLVAELVLARRRNFEIGILCKA